MASRVAALLLLGIVCFELASAQQLVDCCKSTSQKPLPLHVIKSIRIQDEGNGCDIKAAVVLTRAGKILCIAHPDKQEWVRHRIEHVNNRGQRT